MKHFHRSEFIAAIERAVPGVRTSLTELVSARGADVDLTPWLAKHHLDGPDLEWFAEDARFRARLIATRGDRPWRGPASATWTGEYEGPTPPRWEPAITGETRKQIRGRFEKYLDDVEDAEAEAGRPLMPEKNSKIRRDRRWDLLVRRLVLGDTFETLADWLDRQDPKREPVSARGVENAVNSLAERIGLSL
jgi:hypothetical protein